MQHRKNTGLGNFFLKTGTTEARSKFESQSKLVRKLLSQKKKAFYQNKLRLESNNNSREFFRLYNDLACATKNNDQEEKNINVDEFNDFFANIGKKLARNFKTLKELGVRKQINSRFLADITPIEVLNIFESLKTKFSLDTYGLNHYYLKKICPVLLPVLTKLFQKCLDRQVFPDSFKIAKVKPLFKEGNDLDPSNYRPISLLPVVGKIFERVIYNRMNQYLTKYQILQNCQFGFRSKRSTIDALITLIEEVRQDWDSNNTKTQCTFIDLKKAFDTVDHTLLLEKCDAYGFRGPVFDLPKSYLKNRQQYVATKTKRSQNKNVNYGVPQGSILGPLLFIIYINDIELNENSESNLILYADDTVIKTTAKNSDLTGKHQEALDKTASWLEKNKLTLNEDKTKTMILSKKRSDKSDVKMNGIVIEEKQSFRYLGVVIYSKLSFIDHITKIENKLQCFVGCITG